jgi:acyl-CoA thioesterase-1
MRLCLSVLLVVLAACDPAADPDEDAARDAVTDAASAAPAEERPVVVFLGTSLTAGLGLRRASEPYPARLGALADSAGRPIEVVNAGVGGDTSAGGLRRLDWALDRDVDALVIELGANDGLRGQDPSALEENLRTIVARSRARHPDLAILLLGMEAPTNLGSDYTRRFRSVFPRVAESSGIALVPFLLDGVAGVPELNQADAIHPTAAGHDRMARTVWPILDSLLNAHEAQR